MHSFCFNVILLDHSPMSFKIEKCSKCKNELSYGKTRKTHCSGVQHWSAHALLLIPHLFHYLCCYSWANTFFCVVWAYSFRILWTMIHPLKWDRNAQHHWRTIRLIHFFCWLFFFSIHLFTHFWCDRNFQQHFHNEIVFFFILLFFAHLW